MEIELRDDIFDDSACTSIGCLYFDGEFLIGNPVDYNAVRLANSYVVNCNMPETDFDERPIAFCRTVSDVEEFMQSQVGEYTDVEGAELVVSDDIASELSELSDQLSQVCQILDSAFQEEISDCRPASYTSQRLINPSTVIKELAKGTTLRPSKPNGFVIDQDNKVYIQDGFIKFGPIGGFERYFSEELGFALDILGIDWDRQRFTATSDGKFKPESSPEAFLQHFHESRSYLKKRRVQTKLNDLEEQREELEAEIKKAKSQLKDDSDRAR